MMNLNHYQDLADETAVYPGKGRRGGVLYTILGLNGEAGEVAEAIKKAIRDDEFMKAEGNLTPERRIARPQATSSPKVRSG